MSSDDSDVTISSAMEKDNVSDKIKSIDETGFSFCEMTVGLKIADQRMDNKLPLVSQSESANIDLPLLTPSEDAQIEDKGTGYNFGKKWTYLSGK